MKKNKMIIYLAGSVPKGDKETKEFTNWRATYAESIKQIMPTADFIDPFERGEFDESNFLAVFGADCKHIKNCDLVVVNSEEKLGVGTAQEIVIAKYFKKPVITILPKGSHHRRQDILFRGQFIEDWIHPFLYAFSDLILENIGEFSISKLDFGKVKDISVIDQSIKLV